MDKFGIFKLLNSFFSLYGQNSSSNTSNSSSNGSNSTFTLDNLLKSFNNQSTSTKNNGAQEKPSTKPTQVPLPLQADMLKTMATHDQLIARVKQKNPQ